MSFKGTSSCVPAYIPANSLNATPYATLMRRLVVPTQACQTLGDKGDILMADFSQYLSAIKAGCIRSDSSIYLYFDYDAIAYKFVIRVAGQPWLSSAISPLNGSNTVSPFVTLVERALLRRYDMTNALTGERVAVVATVDPDALTAAAHSSDYVDMSRFGSMQAVIMAGTLGSSATLDAKLQTGDEFGRCQRGGYHREINHSAYSGIPG